MIALSVNLNKIALIRNSREGDYPSVLEHAKICIEAGADGITVHPRPDQRHIRPNDVRQLAKLIKPFADREFNVEGNPFAEVAGTYPGFLDLVEETLPDQCTLVPDSEQQLTSDHGFDLNVSGDRLIPIIERLHRNNTRVSLFLDPITEQIRLAKQVGVDRIELYTGPDAANWNHPDKLETLYRQYYKAAEFATSIGLGVNGGHDLNLDNLARFARIPGLLEVSIGHALTVDSIRMGMANAVKAYKKILRAALTEP